MNILIIGNGFDLAHEFPTSYRDFLKFVNEANNYYLNFYKKSIYPEQNIINKNKYFSFFEKLTRKDNFYNISELVSLSSDNYWFKYFNNCLECRKENLNENWIDFENEIASVINCINLNYKKYKNEEIFIKPNSNNFKIDYNFYYFLQIIGKTNITKTYMEEISITCIPIKSYSEFKNKLTSDLHGLIRCLEIYLSVYINTSDNNKRVTDLEDKDIDAILSFNYTNTYERFYDKSCSLKYDYIHGKAKQVNDVKTSQLVLGINEYSDDNNIDFIEYEKFFQRITKKTGCEYIKWIENKEATYNIYIFGHSLDSTDGDILKEFFELKNSKITIFYYDKKAFENQIKNLVKIFGKNYLINSVYASSPKITFKEQNDTKCLKVDTHSDCLNKDSNNISTFKRTAEYFNSLDKYLNYTSVAQQALAAYNATNKALNYTSAVQQAFESCNAVNKALTHTSAVQQAFESCNAVNKALTHTSAVHNAVNKALTHTSVIQKALGKSNAYFDKFNSDSKSGEYK